MGKEATIDTNGNSQQINNTYKSQEIQNSC